MIVIIKQRKASKDLNDQRHLIREALEALAQQVEPDRGYNVTLTPVRFLTTDLTRMEVRLQAEITL